MSDLRRYIDIVNESDDAAYQNLADAGEMYQPGDTEIWYVKKSYEPVMQKGYDALHEQNRLPNINTLYRTHSMIGTVQPDDPEDVYGIMQAEAWDPDGKSKQMLNSVGVDHASMNIGDVVVVNDVAYIADIEGFKEL